MTTFPENTLRTTLAIGRIWPGLPYSIPMHELARMAGVSVGLVADIADKAECIHPLGEDDVKLQPIYRTHYAGPECDESACPLIERCLLYAVYQHEDNARFFPEDMKEHTYHFSD